MFNNVPSLQSMCAQSFYARVDDTIALAELNGPGSQDRSDARNDPGLPIPAEGAMPAGLFNSSRKSELARAI